jgi:hypothetical protein
MLKKLKLNIWYVIAYAISLISFAVLGKYFDWCFKAATYLFFIGCGIFIIITIIVFINFFTKKS